MINNRLAPELRCQKALVDYLGIETVTSQGHNVSTIWQRFIRYFISYPVKSIKSKNIYNFLELSLKILLKINYKKKKNTLHV